VGQNGAHSLKLENTEGTGDESERGEDKVRVTRPGSRIVMGNWIPNDPTLVVGILKISASIRRRPPKASSAR
jgi:hypothetical protein